MDSDCMKNNENPYFICRKKASLYNDDLNSREKTAEMLGISSSTLSNYELGITVPPVNIIMMMADLYSAPQLRGIYCKNECLIGKNVPVAVQCNGIDNITIRIIKQLDSEKIKSIINNLVEIAEDGQVSEKESFVLKDICCRLDGLVEAVAELRLISEKRDYHERKN